METKCTEISLLFGISQTQLLQSQICLIFVLAHYSTVHASKLALIYNQPAQFRISFLFLFAITRPCTIFLIFGLSFNVLQCHSMCMMHMRVYQTPVL